jgi:magnesium transporter
VKQKARSRRHTRIPVPRRDPAAPPGTLTAGPGAEPTRAQVLAYGPDGVLERDQVAVEELRQLRSSYPVVWVSLVGVGDVEAFRRIGDVFGLHVLALEDMVSAHQRPKAEDYEQHLLVVLRHAGLTPQLSLQQVALVVGDGFVLSVEESPTEAYAAIRQRIREGKGRIRGRGADYLAHAIIDRTLDSYLPLVEAHRDQVEALEDQIFSAPDDRAIVELHAIRHDLYAMRRVLTSMRDAVGALARSTNATISEATRLYLRDGQDHASQLLDAVDACRELSSSLAELYNSQLNQRMNEIIKLLTLISTVFIPLSFIAGVYGMNFDPDSSQWNMPELRWRYGYPFALALMSITAGGLLWFFRRKGWLGAAGARGADDRGSAELNHQSRTAVSSSGPIRSS